MSGLSYPFSLKWESRFDAFFASAHIYLMHCRLIHGVYSDGVSLTFTVPIIAESYSTMPYRSFCTMGCHSYSASALPQRMSVGRFCSISRGVRIMGGQHPLDRFTTSPLTCSSRFTDIAREDFSTCFRVNPFQEEKTPPTIDHDVWIGENATMKAGIHVGIGAVLAAESVVTKNVPPYAIVGGVPARLIRYRFPESWIARLLESKWWDFNFIDLPPKELWEDIPRFCDWLDEHSEAGSLKRYEPCRHNVPEALARIRANEN